MIYYKDRKYNFVEYFNEKNGMLIRSNVLENYQETNIVPSMRSFPELIDVGIMGYCSAGQNGICAASGVDCYQNAPIRKRLNMKYDNYIKILQQCSGRCYQFALGGAGDPNKHEDFERILRATREYGIVPNLTTSGYQITAREIELIKRYCGAVAVSYYSKLDENGNESNPSTISSIQNLVDSGCTTNVHYVLSKETISEALTRLKDRKFPYGINSIIFLLYKPIGLANKNKMLTTDDEEYIELLQLVGSGNCYYKVGMDSCQSPGLLVFGSNIAKEAIEFCDAARFSMYIDCDLIAFPCSFGHGKEQFAVDLNENSILDSWDSEQFALFRRNQNKSCSNCNNLECRDCALDIGIDVCGRHTIN